MNDTEHHEYNRREEDRFAVIERHIGTIMGALILASIIWVGTNLTDNIETTARTEVRLSNIEEDIGELKDDLRTSMGDRFTGTQADTLIRMFEKRFTTMETWQKNTEERLDKLEIHNARNGDR